MPDRQPPARLSTPRERTRFTIHRANYDPDRFGRFAEWVARYMGTARFLVWMTALVIVWIAFNIVGISAMHFDPYPFILLNLFFSILASYSAPLILLAQNRQETRDRLSLDEDRRVAAQARADMDFLAREVASIRMGLGEVATRDFIRSELRTELRELGAALERREAVADDKGSASTPRVPGPATTDLPKPVL